jgi:hypothetical protein
MSAWQRTRNRLQCAFGCEIAAGSWVRFGRNRAVLCEACLRQRYGIERPDAPVVAVDDARPDPKVAQAGRD